MYRTLLFLSFIIANFAVGGQRSFPVDAADRLFSEGKDFFELKNYAGSINKLEAYKKIASNRDLIQEADYMLAAIAFEQGKTNAVEILEDFMHTYPDSRHGDEVCLLIGSDYFERKDYRNAARWLSDARADALSIEQQEALHYRLGYAKIQEGDMKAARFHFLVAKGLEGEYFQASTYYIAYIDYATGRYTEAMREFSLLRNERGYEEQANYFIAQINFIDGKYDETIRLVDRLLRAFPDSENNPELYRIAGNAYYQLGNQDRAIAMLRRYMASAAHPSRGDVYLLGVCEFNQRNYKNAVSAFLQTITKEDELTQNASMYLGQSYLQLNDKSNARMAFDHAGALTFNKKIQETALYNYALLVHETAFTGFGESVKVFEKFLNDFPGSEFADRINDYLVEVFLTSKNYASALESINKIRQPSVKILEAKQNVLFQLGIQSFMDVEMEKALEFFNQAITIGNFDSQIRADAYFWRGETHYRLGRYSNAISDFDMYQNVVRYNSSEAYLLVFYNLGYCYFKQRDFERALVFFQRYASLERNQSLNSLADAFNRIGDCMFYARRFSDAADYYSRAANLQPSAADYALYQQGYMLGLQRDYMGKIRLMDRIINEFPTSQHAVSALFEKGWTYVLLDRTNEAASAFSVLLDKYPQSSLAPKAGVRLGLLYYNDNRLDRAIDAYKRVISQYPGSEEAKVALQDLRSVYIDKNDINAYAAYVNSLGGNIRVAASEQDSLTYHAAERLFARGDFEGARNSLTNYLRTYPNGAFSPNANYYLAKIAFDRKNYTEAKRLFTLVLNSRDVKFREEALARKSEIEYLEKDYATAIRTFRELQAVATLRENREAAKLGIMRCAQFTGNESEALTAANELLKETNLAPEIEAEARYLRAKSYLKLGDNTKARDDFAILSRDTRTEYGAEAKYQLAQLYYNAKDIARAEKEALEFIEKSGTSHQYWLARSFILLADIYIDKRDENQARQYLNALKRSYTGNVEIDRMIENRMGKLTNK